MCFAQPQAPKPLQQAPTPKPLEQVTEFALNPLAIKRQAKVGSLGQANPLAILRPDDIENLLENPLKIKKPNNNNNVEV